MVSCNLKKEGEISGFEIDKEQQGFNADLKFDFMLIIETNP